MTKGIITCKDKKTGTKHQWQLATSADMISYSDTTVANALNSLSAGNANAVTKIDGKGLSTNDFTNAYKNTLDNLETNYAKKSDVTAVYRYKGNIQNFESLNSETAVVGDTWNVSVGGGVDVHGSTIKAGDNVTWNGTGWDNNGGIVDLSGGSNAGLQFYIGNSEPTINNVLWLDTTGYEEE